ncbi:MAG TPA: Lrp/AsnC ligand binding domain-containing protein [Candidatus Krumholzibacteria bacterium]|nr:Lrp/AsnC ligand binding domain-containing protein [Candidatus Krumholzibacteria bacterium]
MVTTLMLINTERKLVNEVAESLLEIEGVTEVYSVAGKYDLIAVLRSETNDEMADLVTRHVLEVDGITRSETLMAFRTHSKFDLASLFDVGSESARN